MAGYHERLSSLDGMRYLIRDFTVYGFHTREQYAQASARTYDNDRRRAEGLLKNTLSWARSADGKRLFVSVDASTVLSNPLHRVYGLHTFTDNDLILHFFLLDALGNGEPMDLQELTDAVSDASLRVFDVQTVRRKLNEYVRKGLLCAEKSGKRLLFRLNGPTLDQVLGNDESGADFLSFCREALPFGCLADQMMLRAGWENRRIRFKHHFLMYTLDDIIALPLLEAIHAKRAVAIKMEPKEGQGEPVCMEVLPVCIRVSEVTGRRYLLCWSREKGRARCLRLDMMHNVALLDEQPDADERATQARREASEGWGISLHGDGAPETIRVTLRIDEQKEPFVLRRLVREGRGGAITRLESGLYRYEITVGDSNEMMGWIKTFTGRIVSVEGDNQKAIRRFYEDMELMARMYGEASHGTV